MTTSPTAVRVTHLPPPAPPTYPANTDTTNNTPPPQQHRPFQRPTATTHTPRQQTARAPKNSGFCGVSRPSTRVGQVFPLDVPASIRAGLFVLGEFLYSLGVLRAETGRIAWVPPGGSRSITAGRKCPISASKWGFVAPANFFGGWF